MHFKTMRLIAINNEYKKYLLVVTSAITNIITNKDVDPQEGMNCEILPRLERETKHSSIYKIVEKISIKCVQCCIIP